MTLQRTSYFITAAVIFSLVPIFAQEPKKGEKPQGQSEALLRLETELVQIDVVVTGKDGKLIRDLKREDFELFEDAKKQQITHFAAGTASNPASWLRIERKPSKEGKTVITPREIRTGRYLVLAVDDFHLAPENLLLAKRVLHRFINEQMVANDQVAVVTTSGNIGLFQQFSSEREVLERAINRLSVQTRRATSPSDIPRISDYQAELIDRGDREALDLAVAEIQRLEPQPPPQPAGGGRRGPASGAVSFSPSDRAVMQAQSKARMIVAQNANYTRTTLSTLEGVIRSLQTLPGRKILVMLSDGFYLGGNSSSQLYDLRRIIDAATRAGVVIYSIDARGLVADPPGGGASEPGAVDLENPGARERIEARAIEAMRDGMFSLAHDTGGKAFFNNNDLNLGLQRVLDDNEVYYVLAYEPPESRRDGRFHKIDVKIGGRPDLIVRTRKGYLADNENKLKVAEKSAEKQKEMSPEKVAKEARAEKAAQIKTGLSSLFPLREIQVSMTADFIDVDKAGGSALINAHIDASSLDLEQIDGTHKGRIEMTIAFFDEKGKAAIFSDVLELNFKSETLERVGKFGFNYHKLVPLKPGFYQARLAAREERTARMGSSAAWVEIPDMKRKELTLSGVLLTASDETQPSENETAPKMGYQLRSSTGKRRFKSGGKIDFLVFAYNGKLDKGAPDLVIQSQVYSGSKLVYASPLAKMAVPENSDPQRVPYAARITLEGFDAGEYELRLMSVDRLTKATAYRRVNFTVE
ncbi:MAG: VWA domain-containing protein [Acidobacteria bacterium]|nr:VWA domain-containing protein [Acidobacteriota bacterium]